MHSNDPNHEDLSSSSIKVRSFPALGSLRQETVYEDVDRKSLICEADDSLKSPVEGQETTLPPLSAGVLSPLRVEWRKVGRISFNKTRTITNKLLKFMRSHRILPSCVPCSSLRHSTIRMAA